MPQDNEPAVGITNATPVQNIFYHTRSVKSICISVKNRAPTGNFIRAFEYNAAPPMRKGEKHRIFVLAVPQNRVLRA